jgi:hypothetical protein
MYKLATFSKIILTTQFIFILTNPDKTELEFLKSETQLNTNSKNSDINNTNNFDPNQPCNFTTCSPTQGSCVENKCLCFEGYTTLPKPFEPHCNYKQKSKFIALFLELFFPVGAGHLYAERTISALIKLFTFMLIMCAFCCNLCFIFVGLEQKFLICPSIVFILALITWLILQGIDLVCFGFGIYKDGNGIEMI